MNIIEIVNHYKNNCFWFFLPVIIFNIIITKHLPEFYLKNISHPIVIIEMIVRMITILFSAIMMISLDNKTGNIGLVVYIVGVLIYFVSYIIVIKVPIVSFHNNLFIILAPYWTSILWLIGIGLLGNKLFISMPYHYMVYITLSIVFVMIHSYHGYICYNK